MRKELYVISLLVIGMFWILNPHTAEGVDELYLIGVVKEIDFYSGVITVDVLSGSCFGVRNFRVDDMRRVQKELIGKRISFSIDRSTCEGREIPTMILSGGEGR